jgi:hypothetical protein
MSKPKLLVTLLALALGLPLAATTLPQQNPFAARPQKEHELLQKLAGNWKAEFALSMPGAPPMESEARVESELLGKLWIVTRYDDPQMSGGAFHGAELFGYEPDKKRYVSAWVDNQDASMTLQEGTYDPATRTLAMSGSGKDPMSGRESTSRSTMVWSDDDHRVQQMFVPGAGGDEVQMFTITYTRVK